MIKTNLLQETIDTLTDNGKCEKDILWCGSTGHDGFGWFSWNTFKRVADTEYNSGYGGQRVARDLVIVGIGFWLERHEYDGSEWWEYKTQPIKPMSRGTLKALTQGQSETCGTTLKELN